jgi:hypothetical protein
MENKKRGSEDKGEAREVFKEINEIAHAIFSSIPWPLSKSVSLYITKTAPCGAVFVCSPRN